MAKRTLKLVPYTDKSGLHRWRLIAGNGKQLAKSPRGYKDINRMIVNLNYILSQPHDAEIYKGKDGWRWRFSRGVDGKSRIIAIASEGVNSKTHCKNASDLFLDASPA